MKISLGSDHAGFLYKEAVKKYLINKGHQVLDCGTHSAASCDYPDFIRPAAEAVIKGESERAIIFGGSGNGEAIVANRIKGIRCGVCWNLESVRLTRLHNDANVISIGERMVELPLVLQIVDVFLSTAFEGGRHIPRIQKIDAV